MNGKNGVLLAVLAVCGVALGAVNLRFGFITDTHISTTADNLERMRGAFTLFRSNDVDLVVHGGDIANAHYPTAYTAVSNLFDEVFGAAKPRLIAAVGNHDTQMELGELTQLAAAEETLALVGAENVHTDVRTVNGYTFLTMPYAIGDTAKGFLSWEDYETAVSNACEQAAGKPVFVLEHEPPQNTVYNSHNWGYARSKEILSHYPQVVELSGHVHGSLHNDVFLWQGAFTVVNACCLNSWNGLLKGVGASGGKPSYGALIVEVEDARLVVYRYDVLMGEEIDPEHRWVIPLPFDAASAPYNREAVTAAEVAPSFGAADVLAVTPGATFRTFTLSFPEVQENTMTYWITVESRDGNSWRTVNETEVFSEFWKQTAAKSGQANVTITDDAFEPCAEYRFSVQPVGQYGTRGTAITAMATAATAGEKPDGFVEYVRSTGKQYFDTGVVGRSGTKMEIDIRFDEVGSDTAVLDCRKDDGVNRFFLFHTSRGCAAYGYGDYCFQGHYPLVANRRYHIASELKGGLQTLDIDGTRVVSANNALTFDTGANLYLFACNYLTKSSAQYAIKARVYSLKIWQTDASGTYRLVRDFVPCIAAAGKDSDDTDRRSRAGALFDRVTERIFFAHRASDRALSPGGADTCGFLPDVWNTTSPGRPDYFVEYICSSGSQILDTGVPTRAGLRVEGDMMYTSFCGGEDTYLGANHLPYVVVDRTWKGAWGGLGTWQEGRYLTNETTGVGAVWNANQKYHVTADFRKSGEGDSTITQNGAVIYRTAGTSTESLVNLMVFATWRNGFPAYTTRARCYGLKLWLDDVLVRDFRPCVKGGRPGLYDTVRNEVVFPLVDLDLGLVGYTVNADGSPFVIPWVQTIYNQYVDLGVVGRSGTKIEMDILLPNANNGGDHGIIGARASTATDSRFYPFHQYQNCGRLGYRTFKRPTDSLPDNTWHHVESDLRAGSQTVKVNGITIHSENDTEVVDTGINLYFGAVNVAGKPDFIWPVRVASLKIWQTDTTAAADTDYKLVRDFVPILVEDSQGVLLDRVSGELFTPQSTAKENKDLRFRYEANTVTKVAGRPDAFVEYIESNGRQMLNTGVQVQSGLAASGELMWMVNADLEQTHLGASWWPNRLYFAHNVKGAIWFGHTKDMGFYPLDAQTGERMPWGDQVRQRYDVDYTDRAHLTALIDGVPLMDVACETEIGETSSQLSMFAALSENLISFPSRSRCYWSQIRLNGAVVRDFLPCVKDGKGGLYDAANDEIYFPTVGEITGGLIGPITNGIDLVADKFVEYVESDGNAWIDTGVIGRSGTKAFIEFTPRWAPNAQRTWENVDQGILGARPALWGGTRFFPAHFFGGVLAYGYDAFSGTGQTLTDGTTHKVESDLRVGLQRVTLDGTQVVAENSPTAFDTGLPMYLSAVNVGNEAMFRSPMRIHRVKIWQTATTNADDTAYALVRDYRPVVTCGGILGLKDAVHNALVLPAHPFVACGEPLATGCVILFR